MTEFPPGGGGVSTPPAICPPPPPPPFTKFYFYSPQTTPTTPKANATIIKYPCLSYDPIKMSFLAVVIVVTGKGIYPKHP